VEASTRLEFKPPVPPKIKNKKLVQSHTASDRRDWNLGLLATKPLLWCRVDTQYMPFVLTNKCAYHEDRKDTFGIDSKSTDSTSSNFPSKV
jgi:hypothetical protein